MTAQVLVAPVAAVIAVQVGFGAAFAVNSASFALSALVLRGLREPARPTAVSVSSPFVHAREALTALTGIPLLKALAAGQFLAALSAGATSALLVVLAQERLGGGGYGLLIAAIGLGAATGPLLLLKRIKDPRRQLFVFGPYAMRGVVDLVLAAVTALPLAAAAMVVYGLSTSTGNVTFSSPCAITGAGRVARPGVRQVRRAVAERADAESARGRFARRRCRHPRRVPARRPAAARRGSRRRSRNRRRRQ